MGILRSETMVHGTLVIPHERARDCIDLLARHVHIQYVDMNEKHMDRPYKKYVQRIDQMERMIRVLYEEISKLPNARLVKHNIDNFLQYDYIYRLDQVEESLIKLYDQFEKFRANDSLLRSERDDALSEYYVMLVARKQLNPQLESKSLTFDLANAHSSADDGSDSNEHLLSRESDTEMVNLTPENNAISESPMTRSSLSFTNIAGLISTHEKESFSRAIFRAMRGNVFTLLHDTSDLREVLLSRGLVAEDDLPAGDDKTVFVIYCQSSGNSVTLNKIMKLCTGFQAKIFNWARSLSDALSRLVTLEEVIKDKQHALEAYKKYFRDEIGCLLEVIRPEGNSVIEEWYLFCKKERYLYYILNHFEGSDVTLRADCWFPEEEKDSIRQHLLAEKSQGTVHALLLVDDQAVVTDAHDDDENVNKIPPTYNKTNVLSCSFQGVVDTYGVPRYKEVNPAPFTIITFPFLFGVMFGDIAHGICVTIFALFLIMTYQKLRRKYSGDIANMILNGRYMILLMGLMATYTGFIYNDFLSIPNVFFGTCWTEGGDGTGPMGGAKAVNLLHKKELVPSKESFPVVFGLDSAWIGAENEQAVLHSFKMKFSVIVGFLQMTLGIVLKGLNAIYFRSALDFFFEFIPQLAMMCSFIGYMNFLIFHKWLTPVNNGFAKPSIITTIIDMCMMKKLEKHELMYEGQEDVQFYLMLVVLISIPLMLIPKPLIIYLLNRRSEKIRSSHKRDYEMVYCGEDLESIARENIPNYPQNSGASNEGLRGKFKRVSSASVNPKTEPLQHSVTVQRDDEVTNPHGNAADLFIHQFIETIEFSLGSISNTASYLRLWALSLSHQQLSLVFFKQLMLNILSSSISVAAKVPALFVSSIFFSVVTFFVMLCMDSLECYLHALRLQWVEFQNKFYKADGEPFKPFNLYAFLEENEEE